MILKDIIQWYDTTGFEMIQCSFMGGLRLKETYNRISTRKTTRD